MRVVVGRATWNDGAGPFNITRRLAVFEDFIGLPSEVAARWTALVEQCRPVLANEGMEAVQALLAEQGMSVFQAVAITRALLGWEETSLHDAVDLVDASKARSAASDAD